MSLDHSGLILEFVPPKNNPVAHLHHLYFMRLIGQRQNLMLRYKGRL